MTGSIVAPFSVPYSLTASDTQTTRLPCMLPGTVRTYRADATRLMSSLNRKITAVAGKFDPALTGAIADPSDTAVEFTVVAPATSTGDYAIELALVLSPVGYERWNLLQPVSGALPGIPDDAVLIGNQPVTISFQPVRLEDVQPLPGGAVLGDVVLAIRNGVLGTLLPGTSNGDGAAPTVTLVASTALSGHRAIRVTPAGTAAYADPGAAGYNFAGVSTGAALAGAAVALAQAGTAVVEPSWNWTPGNAVYVGAAGTLTQTLPTTGLLHQIGVALASTALLVQPLNAFRLS